MTTGRVYCKGVSIPTCSNDVVSTPVQLTAKHCFSGWWTDSKHKLAIIAKDLHTNIALLTTSAEPAEQLKLQITRSNNLGPTTPQTDKQTKGQQPIQQWLLWFQSGISVRNSTMNAPFYAHYGQWNDFLLFSPLSSWS
jgi:hypothetical protein